MYIFYLLPAGGRAGGGRAGGRAGGRGFLSFGCVFANSRLPFIHVQKN